MPRLCPGRSPFVVASFVAAGVMAVSGATTALLSAPPVVTATYYASAAVVAVVMTAYWVAHVRGRVARRERGRRHRTLE